MLIWIGALLTGVLLSVQTAETVTLDESPAGPNEWGFRPGDNKLVALNPPSFSWRPQKGASSYELQIAKTSSFEDLVYDRKKWPYNVHTLSRVLAPGKYFWRYRTAGVNGSITQWSMVRAFEVPKDAKKMPLPDRQELLDRIPKHHPRLFVRPEQMEELRSRAKSDLKPFYERLVADCERLLGDLPPTKEPPLYSKGMTTGSDPWREVWWGNRLYTQRVLDGAATLAFTWLLDGNEKYASASRELLMACAKWDPHGSTGYRYNDEAGMPYNYYFCRTYTFLYDYLNEEDRRICRKTMKVRGDEMNDHLNPRHFWRPYGSHANRAWHFLGEIGVTFLGEVEGADEWAWFAANVFMNAYPVWNDDDGGWHEGVNYWGSYQRRFTWWADIMKAAMGIDAFEKPYYSKAGDYAIYLQPPGTKGGGFGDLTARRSSEDNVSLMAIFAAQAQNPYWQWYVDAHGGTEPWGGYVGFVRGALPKVDAKAPTDLPTSKLFRGIGQAYLNTTLLDADDNVEVIFKSSPFGTWSHGYESQNAFLLYAFGERLFIRTGRRDSYGSEHHKQWMWHTKSVNSITVDGQSQVGHSQMAKGEITDFHTSDLIDYVQGEAGDAYGGRLNRFTRRIVFVKPDVVLIYDTLEAPKKVTFEWRLHAPVEMTVNGQKDIRVVNGAAAAQASFLLPNDLAITQTDKFDTPPRPRIKLVEYHLSAATKKKSSSTTFVAVLRPHRSTEILEGKAEIEKSGNTYLVTVPSKNGLSRFRLDGDDIEAEVKNNRGVTTGSFKRGTE